ncbi:MAG: recombination protein O N-terminal domain-containing protein [Spirochaetales bacterium]|nr:recombination protein O N-terminal domain-containing protein [Spirochaetales bacterium]
MSALQKLSGIVIHRRRLGEGDVLVQILLPSGETIDVRAFGLLESRRRSLLFAEPASLVEAEVYTQEGKAALKEGRVIRSLYQGRSYQDLVRTAYILETAGLAARAGAGPDVYRLLEGALESNPADLLLLGFVLIRVQKLLGILGFMEHCMKCQSALSDAVYWSPLETLILCARCDERASRRDLRLVRAIHLGLSRRFGFYKEEPLICSMTDSERLHLFWQLQRSLEQFLGHPLRSAKQLAAVYPLPAHF